MGSQSVLETGLVMRRAVRCNIKFLSMVDVCRIGGSGVPSTCLISLAGWLSVPSADLTLTLGGQTKQRTMPGTVTKR